MLPDGDLLASIIGGVVTLPKARRTRIRLVARGAERQPRDLASERRSAPRFLTSEGFSRPEHCR